jgi:hypothetical protein
MWLFSAEIPLKGIVQTLMYKCSWEEEKRNYDEYE